MRSNPISVLIPSKRKGLLCGIVWNQSNLEKRAFVPAPYSSSLRRFDESKPVETEDLKYNGETTILLLSHG